MTRPKLVLPPESMPWGRWVEGKTDESAAGLVRQTQDASSAGSQFASRAELIQGQISGIPSVSAIYRLPVVDFSVTRVFNPSTVGYVYDSPTYTFNPPRPDRPYGFRVIANMNANGVFFPFARSLLRTNGRDNMFNHENQQPGYEQLASYSIIGAGDIGAGGNVDAQFAIATSGAGTVNFYSCTLWCVFSGSIL